MASVIASDEEDLGTVSDLADIDKAFTKADKALDTIDWLFEKSSKFYYWLTGMGWSQAEIQTMVDQIEFYGEFGGVREFIDAYSSVSGMMDLFNQAKVVQVNRGDVKRKYSWDEEGERE